jgi:hypothetical protein
MDEFHIFAEKLMSDALFRFTKTKFNILSVRKRRSLYHKLRTAVPSIRCIILSSKSETTGVTGRIIVDPIEQNFGALLGQSRVLSEELKLLVVQVYEAVDVPFEGVRALNRSTKREAFEWIGENWDALGETFTTIAANQ